MLLQRTKLATFSLASAFICLASIAENADAQIFRKIFRQGAQQSSCPGGNCPQVYSASSYQPSYQTYAVPVQSRGHWTYPGTISGHLNGTHGVATAGMTREQMLNLHDAIHEGRVVQSRVVPVAAPIIRTQPAAPKPAPSLPAISTASSSSLFGLGDLSTLDEKPKPAAVIPDYVLGQIDPAAGSSIVEAKQEASASFRSTLLRAISEARKSGKINFRDAVKLRVAMLSPAFVERAQELAVAQVAFSGEESELIPIDENGVVQVDGINWEGLAKFLEAFVPLLISLLKAFGL